MKTHHDLAHLPKDLINELRDLVSEANALVTSSVSEYSADALAGLRARINAELCAEFAILAAYKASRSSSGLTPAMRPPGPPRTGSTGWGSSFFELTMRASTTCTLSA